MEHDFEIRDGEKRARTALNGRICTSIRGIMDYDLPQEKWTACSAEDLAKYYASVVEEEGRFCLEKITETHCSTFLCR